MVIDGNPLIVHNLSLQRMAWAIKHDKDALDLARLGHADRNLLGPIIHGSEEIQHDLLQIKLRDNLVRREWH